MLNGIIIGIVLGLVFGWKLRGWWTNSSIKKATDIVGSAAQGPAKAAKGLLDKLKSFWPGNDKRDKEDE